MAGCNSVLIIAAVCSKVCRILAHGLFFSEAIEELGYGSAADAATWLKQGGGIREVNAAQHKSLCLGLYILLVGLPSMLATKPGIPPQSSTRPDRFGASL